MHSNRRKHTRIITLQQHSTTSSNKKNPAVFHCFGVYISLINFYWNKSWRHWIICKIVIVFLFQTVHRLLEWHPEPSKIIKSKLRPCFLYTLNLSQLDFGTNGKWSTLLLNISNRSNNLKVRTIFGEGLISFVWTIVFPKI